MTSRKISAISVSKNAVCSLVLSFSWTEQKVVLKISRVILPYSFNLLYEFIV